MVQKLNYVAQVTEFMNNIGLELQKNGNKNIFIHNFFFFLLQLVNKP